MKRAPLAVAALVVAAAGSARAASVTVGNAADLVTAVGMAQPGDVITLADGTYNLAGPLQASAAGNVGAPIRVAAAHPGKAILVAAGGAEEAVRISGAYWTFDGVDFHGGQFGVRVVNGALGATVARAHFVDDSLAGLRADCGGPDSGSAAHCDRGVVDTVDVTRGALTNACAFAGIEIVGGNNWIVRNVRVHDVGIDTLGCPSSGAFGIALRANAQMASVTGIIVHHVGTGIAAGAPTTNACEIRGAVDNGNGTCTPPPSACAVQSTLVGNALIYDTSVEGILAGSPCDVKLHAITLWNTGSAPARSIDGTGNGSVDVSDVILDTSASYGSLIVTGGGNVTLPSPADTSWFIDASHANFRLLPGVPPVDHGVTLSDVTVDLDGFSRPQGSAFDVGAYERPLSGYPDGGVPADGGTGTDGGGTTLPPGGGGQPLPVDKGCHCNLGGDAAGGPSALAAVAALLAAFARRRRRG